MAFRFLKSSHKSLYIRLAFKFRCRPDHVYDLAHRRVDVETRTDYEIVRYFAKHRCFANVHQKPRHTRPSSASRRANRP